MRLSAIAENTKFIKEKAREMGFQYCGISKAEFLEEEAPRLDHWLKNNMQGTMRWMENHYDKRLDPRLLVDGAKSVISFLLNYYPDDAIESQEGYKISKYAYGQDYHFVIKDKLKALMQLMEHKIGAINGRVFVDSAPVMDKSWAKKSGLGWVGKNANLINKNSGSYFFIAELIVDIELEYDGPVKDYCGTCTRCIDACPTAAIEQPFVVNGSKCISYLTIELKEHIPEEFKGKMENWIFGCDICQEVCPWNKFATPNQEKCFDLSPELVELNGKEWNEITSEVFSKVFRNSSVKRTGYKGLKRNMHFVK